MPRELISMVDKKYWKLTGIELKGFDKSKHAMWLFRCDCGTEKVICGLDVRRGRTKSCGCSRIGSTWEVIAHCPNTPPALYRLWCEAINRCENPESPDYADCGGREISIYPSWHKFKTFRKWAQSKGYADCMRLVRRDDDGNYEPWNCYFAAP